MDVFPDNSLSHFTNTLPTDMLKDVRNGQWEMCLAELAFHRKFVNKHFPANPKVPTLALIPTKTFPTVAASNEEDEDEDGGGEEVEEQAVQPPLFINRR